MLYTAFILGLLGSLHCLGMCGPIAFMLPLGKIKGSKKLFFVSLYHLGRLASYGLLGAVFGILGKGMTLFGLQQKISVGIGILMIVSILIPMIFSSLKFSNNLAMKTYSRWIFKIQSLLGKSLKKSNPDNFLSIGFLNGLLPCGLVSMALLGAIGMGSGAAYHGFLYMIFFGLGTVPMMSGAIYASQFLKQVERQRIKKIIPFFVVIIGGVFILRGLGLGIPYISPKTNHLAGSNAVECHEINSQK